MLLDREPTGRLQPAPSRRLCYTLSSLSSLVSPGPRPSAIARHSWWMLLEAQAIWSILPRHHHARSPQLGSRSHCGTLACCANLTYTHRLGVWACGRATCYTTHAAHVAHKFPGYRPRRLCRAPALAPQPVCVWYSWSARGSSCDMTWLVPHSSRHSGLHLDRPHIANRCGLGNFGPLPLAKANWIRHHSAAVNAAPGISPLDALPSQYEQRPRS